MGAFDEIREYENGEGIPTLKTSKIVFFKSKLKELRHVMELIGKSSITLNTSEPLGPGHSTGENRKYSLIVERDRVKFLDSMGKVIPLDDDYLSRCQWFQVYIYIVEMELEMIKVLNQIKDSLSVVNNKLK